MADDSEKNRQQSGQFGQQGGQSGQHGNQPGQQKDQTGQGGPVDDENEDMDRQRRAS